MKRLGTLEVRLWALTATRWSRSLKRMAWQCSARLEKWMWKQPEELFLPRSLCLDGTLGCIRLCHAIFGGQAVITRLIRLALRSDLSPFLNRHILPHAEGSLRLPLNYGRYTPLPKVSASEKELHQKPAMQCTPIRKKKKKKAKKM